MMKRSGCGRGAETTASVMASASALIAALVSPLVHGIAVLAGCAAMIAHAASNLRVLRALPAREVFKRQILFSGIDGLPLIAVLGLVAGALIVTQATALTGADSELAVRVLQWTVVGELGPLLAAIILTARSGVAVATELALMSVRGETATLERMRVDPLDYLVVPRIVALTLSSVALTIYFQAVAIAGGLAISALTQHAPFLDQLGRFLDVVSFGEIGVSTAKSAVFGALIAAIACRQGLTVLRALTAVPVAAMRAVIHCLLAVFLIDITFAAARFALA